MKFGENLYNLRKAKKIKGISKAIYILARIGKIAITIAIPVIVLLLIVTPIFINNIELKDNTIVFKGSRIDDRITITEEKSNNGTTLQLKANGILISDAKNQD